MTDNIRVWTSQDKHIAEEAMWRVVKEYCDAHRAGAAVNIWHLEADMRAARQEAVAALRETKSG